MNAEVNEAYESAKKLLEQLRNMHKRRNDALKFKGEKKTNLAKVIALVTKEVEGSGVSKTALKEIVKGDDRVLLAEEELTFADIELKWAESYVSYTEKAHDLEKKRMSAEMEEAKRIDLST